MKEAGILRYLTMRNDVVGQYVVQFVDFFKTDNAYFLVMEYIDNSMSLTEYIEKMHRLLREKVVSKKRHLKIIKYIFWFVPLFICCHLVFANLNCVLSGSHVSCCIFHGQAA